MCQRNHLTQCFKAVKDAWQIFVDLVFPIILKSTKEPLVSYFLIWLNFRGVTAFLQEWDVLELNLTDDVNAQAAAWQELVKVDEPCLYYEHARRFSPLYLNACKCLPEPRLSFRLCISARLVVSDDVLAPDSRLEKWLRGIPEEKALSVFAERKTHPVMRPPVWKASISVHYRWLTGFANKLGSWSQGFGVLAQVHPSWSGHYQ